MMLIKNIHETGWFNANPQLNAPFEQRWAEWPMGGDLLAYTVKKALVQTTGDVPLTFNLFWLLTFPLTALIAFPVLRSLRCSWATALVGAVLFSLTPYHFRNGAGHENLAFYVGIPVIVLLCARVLGPDGALPSVADLRHRAAWWRLRWLLLGTVLVGVTGIYYLAFLVTLLAICAGVSALARRRPGRLLLAAIFSGVGLATSFLANFATLLYRWQHTPNLLGVPDRPVGVSEAYPLRLVELLSPVTQHRFGPFAALADHLYEPGREGFGTAQLGLVGAIGLVCALTTVLVRALRRSERGGWALEARLGIVIVAALVLATKGGLSRPLELVGLEGVRAWTRIAIVVAFASVVVFARLLDRLRVVIRRHHWPRPRLAFTAILASVLVLGVLDQASPAQMPDPRANARRWRSDAAFVAALERTLPKNAMVFQLPVVDFPEHSAIERLSGSDPHQGGLPALHLAAVERGRRAGSRRRVAVPGVRTPGARSRAGNRGDGLRRAHARPVRVSRQRRRRGARSRSRARAADRRSRRAPARVGSATRRRDPPPRHGRRGAQRVGAADARRAALLLRDRRRPDPDPRKRAPRHLRHGKPHDREPRAT